MTGFGRGEASNGHVTVVVELKSVNNRFKDVQLRMPREYGVWEPRLLGVLRDGITRGRLDAFVRRTGLVGNTRVTANLELADQYRKALSDLARRLQRDPAEITLALVAAQPGVLGAEDADPDVSGEWEMLATAADGALTDLNRMRDTEGAALQRDLRQHLAEVERLRTEIATHADGYAERAFRRLADRIARLVGERADPARVHAEAALLAEKADTAEEVARLGSHVEQFADALASAEPVGRRLDFLLQEMNREINTIGSKAAEQPISSRVVELKTILERLREQAANVE